MAMFQFTLIKGHQIASGIANDPRFPHGTITAQLTFFHRLGLDLGHFYPATLNAQFNCSSIAVKRFDYEFEQVKWHESMPVEDFKFTRCTLVVFEQRYSALIYQPQVTTKTEHFQPNNQLEILAPFIAQVSYGDTLGIEVPDDSIVLVNA